MSQGYVHSSHPRPIAGGASGIMNRHGAGMTQTATSASATIRRLYREGQTEEVNGVNIMFDPRVRRGVTSGKPVPVLATIQKSTLSAKQVREQRAAEKKYLIQTGQIRPTLKSTSELHASIVVPKWRTEVDLSKHLIEQVKPVVYLDKEIQTDAIKEPPATPPFQARKFGHDQGTQVQNSLVFDFDTEAVAIADILVSGTFDQALLEVREDEELKNTVAAKLALERKQAAHTKETNKRVEAERDLSYRKARMAREAQATATKEAIVREKFAAHTVAQNFLVKLQEDTMTGLGRDGYLIDPQQRTVNLVFMPWLEERVRERLDLIRGCTLALDEILASGIAIESENARICKSERNRAAREEEEAKELVEKIADRRRRERSTYRISIHSEFSQEPLGPIEVAGSKQVDDVLKEIVKLLLGEDVSEDVTQQVEGDESIDKYELARRSLSLKRQKRLRAREASRFQLSIDRHGAASESIGLSRSVEDATEYASSLSSRIDALRAQYAATNDVLGPASISRSQSDNAEQTGEAEMGKVANGINDVPEDAENEDELQYTDGQETENAEENALEKDANVEEEELCDEIYALDFNPRLLVGPSGILPRNARLCDLPIEPSTQLRLVLAPLSSLLPEYDDHEDEGLLDSQMFNPENVSDDAMNTEAYEEDAIENENDLRGEEDEDDDGDEGTYSGDLGSEDENT